MRSSRSNNRNNSIRPRIGITLGDPAGIGPEIVMKALAKSSIGKIADFRIIGDPSLTPQYRYTGNWIEPALVPAAKITPGKPSRYSAAASFSYLEKAVELLKTEQIDALVTAPVSKEGIASLGKKFLGHTEFLAEAFHVKNFEMMFVSETLRTIVVTRHIPLVEVSRAVTAEKVYDTISLAQQSLRKFFQIPRPRIGVCGINPHAGEAGHIGKEEGRKVIPAIRRAQKAGIDVQGPLAADTVFSPVIHKNAFDVIIAMYHDQGLIPIKTLHFPQVVNLTIGLPFIRTSPAHGTAFDIAGKNKADYASMEEAIRLAARLALAV